MLVWRALQSESETVHHLRPQPQKSGQCVFPTYFPGPTCLRGPLKGFPGCAPSLCEGSAFQKQEDEQRRSFQVCSQCVMTGRELAWTARCLDLSLLSFWLLTPPARAYRISEQRAEVTGQWLFPPLSSVHPVACLHLLISPVLKQTHDMPWPTK